MSEAACVSAAATPMDGSVTASCPGTGRLSGTLLSLTVAVLRLRAWALWERKRALSGSARHTWGVEER